MNNNFITINWHLTEKCNFKCFFCFAKYNINEKELHNNTNNIDLLLNKLYLYFSKTYKVVNLNLVGGEPLLSKNINYIIEKAFNLGFNVSIISNGSLINKEFLDDNSKYLSTIGISIDSLNNETNNKIGRLINKNYKDVLKLINQYDINLKINTVINKYNFSENFVEELKEFKINKWKFFQAINVLDDKINCLDEEFKYFLDINNIYHLKDNKYYIENKDVLLESYIMIDPFGRFFQNINNKYQYTKNILDNDIEECFNNNIIDLNKFKNRY